MQKKIHSNCSALNSTLNIFLGCLRNSRIEKEAGKQGDDTCRYMFQHNWNDAMYIIDVLPFYITL